MLKNRIIPCLLLGENGLVKTKHFKNPSYVGDPINAIRIFNEKEVDEIIVLDIEASKKGLEPNYNLIEEFASECFMPLSYGGGIKNLEHAKRLFSLGVEKVVLKTSVLQDSTLIREISNKYGSQSVVVSLDIKQNWTGRYHIYDHVHRSILKTSWINKLKEYIDAGVGEIFLNSVDRDGTLSGLDLDLIENVSSNLIVPLIACGGANGLDNFLGGVNAGASAIAVGAFFVYHGPYNAVLITYPKYDDLEKLFER